MQNKNKPGFGNADLKVPLELPQGRIENVIIDNGASFN
jgi:hypothetical protein